MILQITDSLFQFQVYESKQNELKYQDLKYCNLVPYTTVAVSFLIPQTGKYCIYNKLLSLTSQEENLSLFYITKLFVKLTISNKHFLQG